MPSEHTKILEFNQYQKPVKGPFIIYEDLECLTKNFGECKNNPENSSTSKVDEHFSSGSLISTYHHLIAQKINMMYAEVKIVR